MLYVKDPIHWEKNTLIKMVRLYCRAKHQTQDPCDNCRQLITYAIKRLDACKYGASKPTCEKCPVHCYQPVMRDKIKKIMRYAGPRMIIYHPLDALRHVIKKMN